MSKQAKFGLIFIAVAVVLVIAGVLALPTIIDALPNQIRARMPEAVLIMASTPIPTALPAPVVTNEDLTVPVPVVTPQTPTQTPTPKIVPTSTTTPPGRASESPPTITLTSEPSMTPTGTATTLPKLSKIEGIEVIAQEFNNCGPANLTMVLNYFGQEIDQYDVGGVLKPHYDDRNVSPEEMTGYVNAYTQLQANAYSGGDLDILKQLITAGLPVIIEKGLELSEHQGWMGHYLTVYGYDDREQVFQTMDTFLGPWDSTGRNESYETINELWQHFNYTFIVVHRADQTDEVEKIIGPEITDPVSMWQNALSMAQATLELEPENAFAWFNLGTSLTSLGEITGDLDFFEGAVVAFDQAREIGLPWRMLWYQFKPYVAYLAAGRFEDILTLGLAGPDVEETYLYKGHVLFAQGNSNGAGVAYRRALELNPNMSAAKEALADLSLTAS